MNYIHEYIYNNKRQPIGVWAAAPCNDDPDVVYIGWSRCNSNAGDRFDKARGVNIAYERSRKGSTSRLIPESMDIGYTFFKKRAERYFKNRTVLF